MGGLKSSNALGAVFLFGFHTFRKFYTSFYQRQHFLRRMRGQ